MVFSGPVVLALFLGTVALFVAVGAFFSLASIRRRLVVALGRGRQEDILQAVSSQIEQVTALRGEIRQMTTELHRLADVFRGALQRFAVYRYDAFEDMGGQLSFSAAILNDHGDGLVISCINGRQEARTYAKPVSRATSPYNLSPEEQEAIRLALATVGQR